MKHHLSMDEVGIFPIIGAFISKAAEEVGYTRLVVGTLMSLILAGVLFNLNSISTDVRDLRASIKAVVISDLEKARCEDAKIARIETNQQIVMRDLAEIKADVKRHFEHFQDNPTR